MMKNVLVKQSYVKTTPAQCVKTYIQEVIVNQLRIAVSANNFDKVENNRVCHYNYDNNKQLC